MVKSTESEASTAATAESKIEKQEQPPIEGAVDGSSGSETPENRQLLDGRLVRQLTLIFGALTLALYLRALAPGLLAGDPGEFQVAAWTLGLAHPTGYPTYLLLGHLWQKLLALVGISPSTALNAFSAVCSAAAVGLLFRLQVRWTGGPRNIRLVASTIGTLFFALNPTFWNQSLIAEVYSLHMFFFVAILLITQRYLATLANNWFWLLCVLVGFALTHHAMTIWLLPGITVALIGAWRHERPSLMTILGGILLVLLPLLLYLYIPLRSGSVASPWYHQALGPAGAEVLTLYENSWTGFMKFFTGQSISVGFRSLPNALGQLGFAFDQWRLHFTWVGLVVALLGLGSLVSQRRWSLLAITGLYCLFQQIFNLFYAIDDIFVYYIPLYAIGALWVGLGVSVIGEWLAERIQQMRSNQPVRQRAPETMRWGRNRAWTSDTAGNMSALLLAFFAILPFQLAQTFYPQLNQSTNNGTRVRWQEILNAVPPQNAIVVSNDRNEIVPLFYLQHVEKQVPGLSGLFPLIAPEERFADIGSTLSTVLELSAERPVVLIKPMAGIETLFRVKPLKGPLVEVLGHHDPNNIDVVVGQTYGPLTLLGYRWTQDQGEESSTLNLLWQVNQSIGQNYTTSVQFFDESDQKIGQDDRPPGGLFYPTSLWKPGEIAQDVHPVTLPADTQAVKLLINLYQGEDFQALAPALEISLEEKN